MNLALAVALCVTCCSCSTTFGASAPTSVLPTYPHVIEYELLAQVRGKACESADAVASSAAPSTRESVVGPRYLYQRAKAGALDQTQDADGLLAVRALYEVHDGQHCVAITGRAYRIKAIRAVPPPSPTRGKVDGMLIPDGYE